MDEHATDSKVSEMVLPSDIFRPTIDNKLSLDFYQDFSIVYNMLNNIAQ